MTHLSVQDIEKSFGAVPVLKGCSLEIEKGSIVTLLGPSGCGKTTLLRAIAGFNQPDHGTIRVRGSDITNLPSNRRDVGYVFQNYALFPHLTVAGNVAYGLKVRRVSSAEIQKRVGEALELVSLSGLAGRYPKELSGGQQQRVAIARSMVLRPEVLLLDEPFNALDAQLRIAVQLELRKLIEQIGITSIFVTHDQQEALMLSDRVAIMRGGRIEQFGAPMDIYDKPRTAFVADFIGRANLVPIEIRSGQVAGHEHLRAERADGDAVLMVRPENLEIRTDEGPGWKGTIGFSTALGTTIEYEIHCGMQQPLRAILPRKVGLEPYPKGTDIRVTVRDSAATVVFGAN